MKKQSVELQKFMNEMLLVLSFVVSSFFQIAAQDDLTVTYSDSFVNNSATPTNLPALSKAQRVNRNSSTIISTNPNLDEQVKKSLGYAVSVWEASILDCDSIFIQVNIEDIDEDIRTTVRYSVIDGFYVPSALETYKDPSKSPDFTNPHGIITISSNTTWDYGLGDNISPSGKNLAYGLMRAIARILGFGSSVAVDDSGNYSFSLKNGYSVFDKLITNSNGVKLISIGLKGGNANENLKSFITAPMQTFWVNANSRQYQLQSPPYSVDLPPFGLLNDEKSLMGRDLQVGSYVFQVDNATQAILNELGWNISPSALIKILSDDISDTGLASAYESHSFSIERGVQPVQNPKWELVLPLANGERQSILLADNNLSATVAPIANEELYQINSDGDIEGVLNFSCSINGKEERATPFKIHFELKPLIEHASIEKVVDNAPLASYDAYYKVNYRGADKIKVSVEEEYGSKLKSWIINEPYIAYGIADHITTPYRAWIDFIAENKYGKSVYTIELLPYGIVSSVNANQADANDTFDVYDIKGIKLGILNNLSDIRQIQQKGLLIIKHRQGGVLVETLKRMNP